MTSFSSHVAPVARISLGTAFVVFGLNGFLNFLPAPPPAPAALPFLSGLAAAGYFFPLLKSLEVIAGVLLLTNRFVPLALAVLAPIVVHITAFHVFLDPAGLALALALLALELFLAWSYREAYRPMLAAEVRPTQTPTPSTAVGPAYGRLSSQS